MRAGVDYGFISMGALLQRGELGEITEGWRLEMREEVAARLKSVRQHRDDLDKKIHSLMVALEALDID